MSLTKVLDYCAKGLDFCRPSKSLEFVFLWNDIGLCFSNMTNMRELRHWELREKSTFSPNLWYVYHSFIVTTKREIYLPF